MGGRDGMMEEIGNYDWMKIREFFVSGYLWKYDLLKKKNEIDSLRVNLDVDGAQFEQLYQNFYTDILSLQPFFFETDCVKTKIYKVNCEKSLQTFDRSEGIKLMHN